MVKLSLVDTNFCINIYTKCFRVWDISSGSEVKKIDLEAAPTSLELSHDGSVVTVTYGSTTSFWNAET
jgi:serine-threonine kinase receptor-associated protein